MLEKQIQRIRARLRARFVPGDNEVLARTQAQLSEYFEGRRRDFDLPLFNEVASNFWVPSKDPRAIAWQNKLATFDAFIFVTPEYNRSIPGALKNALDQAYKEWVRKPAAIVGYGMTGAARAAEHLRTIAIELQMVPIRTGVHILWPVMQEVMGGKNLKDIEFLQQGAKDMLDQLAWYTKALTAAREADALQAKAA